MGKQDSEASPELQEIFRKHFRESLQHDSGLEYEEFSLFEWYAKETDSLIASMRQAEAAELRRQQAAGVEVLNDSGMVAVDYFERRTRYSHVIFLASVFEGYLTRACGNLARVLNPAEMPFALEELVGEKWIKRRRFLERYGRFTLTSDEWAVADELARVRNVLVHENGSVASLSDKQRAELESRPGLKLEAYELVIESQYVQTLSKGLQHLIATIQARIQRRARELQGP